MSKRAIAYLVVAVLVIGGAAAALAASMGGDDGAMRMPNGQTMTGTMSGSTMTMEDGSKMPGNSMPQTGTSDK